MTRKYVALVAAILMLLGCMGFGWSIHGLVSSRCVYLMGGSEGEKLTFSSWRCPSGARGKFYLGTIGCGGLFVGMVVSFGFFIRFRRADRRGNAEWEKWTKEISSVSAELPSDMPPVEIPAPFDEPPPERTNPPRSARAGPVLRSMVSSMPGQPRLQIQSPILDKPPEKVAPPRSVRTKSQPTAQPEPVWDEPNLSRKARVWSFLKRHGMTLTLLFLSMPFSGLPLAIWMDCTNFESWGLRELARSNYGWALAITFGFLALCFLLLVAIYFINYAITSRHKKREAALS